MILQKEKELNENYQKFAGKYYELSTAAVEADPTLKLVRGHYYDPVWGERAHWWTVRPDGTIYDLRSDGFTISICRDGRVRRVRRNMYLC